MTSPVMHMRRTATEDTEIAGQRIAENEKVIMWYGAANRDPAVFPNPDVFDLTRQNVEKHVAFGHGVHRCLGNRIAQMQLRMAYERILERFPNIHWTGKQKIEPIILTYLNRLSDYMFVLSRKLTLDLKANEIPWKPRM